MCTQPRDFSKGNKHEHESVKTVEMGMLTIQKIFSFRH